LDDWVQARETERKRVLPHATAREKRAKDAERGIHRERYAQHEGEGEGEAKAGATAEASASASASV